MAQLIVFVYGFAAGVWALQQMPVLPSPWGALSIVLIGLWWRFKSLLLLAIFAVVLGFQYANLRAQWRMSEAIPTDLIQQAIWVDAVVSEMPQVWPRGQRLTLSIERASEKNIPQNVSVFWSTTEAKAGERWRLKIYLQPPHGLLNFHGFDQEAWLLQHHIRATGSVDETAVATRLNAWVWQALPMIEQVRGRLRDRMRNALGEHPMAGVILALAVGDQQAIKPSDWTLYNQAGISHLLSISGMHVTLLAMAMAWLTFQLWRRYGSRQIVALQVASIVSLVCSLAYALISGFAIPAQRTLIMLTVAAIAVFFSRRYSAWLCLAAALFVVLIFDPWAVLSAGFWFSYLAVVFLFYFTLHRVDVVPQNKTQKLQNALRLQWVITLALAPVGMVLFQQISLLSPLANLIAIPLLSFVVVPLCLLWLLLPIDVLLYAAAWLMQTLHECIQASPLPQWFLPEPPAFSVPFIGLAIVLLFSPRLLQLRWLAVPLSLPFFSGGAPAVPKGEIEVTALDVGQGTAILLRTTHKTLLFDTGPNTGQTDAGQRVVLPQLRAMGIQLDALILSHSDADHTGGALSILREFPQTQLYASLNPSDTFQSPKPFTQCLAGQTWTWDEVHFEYLHPSPEDLKIKKTNDRACVLKISSKAKSVLLTADIEAVTEQALLNRNFNLKSDLLSMPHHGSNTSSTSAFVQAVAPEEVFVNAGYLNRFAHPHPLILSHYQGSRIRNTAHLGAVRYQSLGNEWLIEEARLVKRRYWHHRN